MSERLPVVSAQDLMRVLKKHGYHYDHQEGSHITMRNTFTPYDRITVPNHREISKGTLRGILRQAGLSVENLRSTL
jgi:predicted RNA binding protein YcfA (HicA-like mRNA interferase family)